MKCIHSLKLSLSLSLSLSLFHLSLSLALSLSLYISTYLYLSIYPSIYLSCYLNLSVAANKLIYIKLLFLAFCCLCLSFATNILVLVGLLLRYMSHSLLFQSVSNSWYIWNRSHFVSSSRSPSHSFCLIFLLSLSVEVNILWILRIVASYNHLPPIFAHFLSKKAGAYEIAASSFSRSPSHSFCLFFLLSLSQWISLCPQNCCYLKGFCVTLSLSLSLFLYLNLSVAVLRW